MINKGGAYFNIYVDPAVQINLAANETGFWLRAGKKGEPSAFITYLNAQNEHVCHFRDQES